MREEPVVATPAITPSPEWLERRAAQMQNVKIVRGGRGIEVAVGTPVAEKTVESLSPLEGKMLASGWEMDWS